LYLKRISKVNNKGFTLIELMIVIAILAILFVVAVPAYKNLQVRQKINGQANFLFSVVYQARSEAIKRSSVVTICKSNNGQACGGTWSDGWLMFADQDADGALEPSENMITAGRLDSQIDTTWSAFGSNNYIRLTQRGMTLAQNGTFKLCPENGDPSFARVVVVSKLARVRLPPVGKDADGSSIVCD
jgi:type IV fimbrial biogenesis protein FimT